MLSLPPEKSTTTSSTGTTPPNAVNSIFAFEYMARLNFARVRSFVIQRNNSGRIASKCFSKPSGVSSQHFGASKIMSKLAAICASACSEDDITSAAMPAKKDFLTMGQIMKYVRTDTSKKSRAEAKNQRPTTSTHAILRELPEP